MTYIWSVMSRLEVDRRVTSGLEISQSVMAWLEADRRVTSGLEISQRVMSGLEISESVYAELELAGRAVILGAALIFAYDILRVIRRLMPHNNLCVNVEDMLYWIFFTVAVFSMLHSENDGRMRAYVIIGMAVGMLVFGKLIKILRNQLRNVVKLFKIRVDTKQTTLVHDERQLLNGRKTTQKGR